MLLQRASRRLGHLPSPSAEKSSPASMCLTLQPPLLLPRRRCRVNGALVDELVLVTGVAPLLGTNLRAEPCAKLHATDASPRRLRCAHHTRSMAHLCTCWPRKKESTRAFDWTGDEPPISMRDGRAAAAPLALPLNCSTLFSCRVLGSKHINLLELDSLISLLKRVTREGMSV